MSTTTLTITRTTRGSYKPKMQSKNEKNQKAVNRRIKSALSLMKRKMMSSILLLSTSWWPKLMTALMSFQVSGSASSMARLSSLKSRHRWIFSSKPRQKARKSRSRLLFQAATESQSTAGLLTFSNSKCVLHAGTDATKITSKTVEYLSFESSVFIIIYL